METLCLYVVFFYVFHVAIESIFHPTVEHKLSRRKGGGKVGLENEV